MRVVRSGHRRRLPRPRGLGAGRRALYLGLQRVLWDSRGPRGCSVLDLGAPSGPGVGLRSALWGLEVWARSPGFFLQC
jgi:hypothetical protein